jgi:hypothetical protein
VFENGVLRRIFGPKMDKVTQEWSCTSCTDPQVSLGMWHAWERRYKCISFQLGSLKERDHSRPRGRWEDVEWIQLARVRDQWQALVNAAMNLLILALRN